VRYEPDTEPLVDSTLIIRLSCIKETNTVGSKASCDLFADRRLCLTGTPVQNKLDDIFALIKFLRVSPLDDKSTWMEFIGSPVKYGQTLGIARLQTIMKCITLRRTKETRAQDGKKILALPPRKDELRYLKFNKEEQEIYDQFFNESKAEFKELSHRNEVMKNYVGILQKILRLRQICDHFELVKKPKETPGADGSTQSYEEIAAAITKEGINTSRASALFALLKEAGTTQCVECGGDLGGFQDGAPGESAMDADPTCLPSAAKRGKKSKAPSSRANTRPSSPSAPRIVLTRCQHLFCLECFRQSVFPGWPGVAPDVFRVCSVCQCSLGMADAVETSAEATSTEAPRRKTVKKEKRVKGVNPENVLYSTKVNALLGDLMQTSRHNPYSANFDPTDVDVKLIDGEGNDLDDGVVKTIVL
jgi:SWI/SNF-related matrix-associated actin-dependent regulator of chromatin subfamily A3